MKAIKRLIPSGYVLFGLLILVMAVSLEIYDQDIANGNIDLRQIGENLLETIRNDFLGIAVAILIIDYLARRRERRLKTSEDKERIIRDLRSGIPEFAQRAAKEMITKHWLYDGSLKGMDLSDVDLRKVDLTGANLSGARLVGADFRDTIITLVDFRGADLSWAYFEDARYLLVYLDTRTILPDGTCLTEITYDRGFGGTSLPKRFTDSNHYGFFSPYRGPVSGPLASFAFAFHDRKERLKRAGVHPSRSRRVKDFFANQKFRTTQSLKRLFGKSEPTI